MWNNNTKYICEDCGTVGFPTKKVAGAFWVELLLYIIAIVFAPMTLLLSLLIPIAYSIRRHTASTRVCYKCGGKMIPIDTPGGRKLIKEFQIKEDPIVKENHISGKPPIFRPKENKPEKHHKASSERRESLKEKYKDLL